MEICSYFEQYIFNETLFAHLLSMQMLSQFAILMQRSEIHKIHFENALLNLQLTNRWQRETPCSLHVNKQ